MLFPSLVCATSCAFLFTHSSICNTFEINKALLIVTRVIIVLVPLRFDESVLLIVAMQSSHPSCSVPQNRSKSKCRPIDPTTRTLDFVRD
jgi:hypothetical protein